MRNIMGNFYRFMYGRYGADQFYFFLLGLYFVLTVVNIFFYSYILRIICTLILIYSFYRVLSRNIMKRRRENEKFLSIWDKTAPDFKFHKMRMKEWQTHAFHKCPYCGSTLRLPRKKGKFPITCPKCNQRFYIRNWF